jgi:hypothetical protein
MIHILKSIGYLIITLNYAFWLAAKNTPSTLKEMAGCKNTAER